MKISILTLFPEVFGPYFGSSIPGRGQENGLFSVETVNIRDYSTNKHQHTDDAPFGGGAGMVMMPQPIFDCMDDVMSHFEKKPKVLFMSPCGRVLDNHLARELAQEDGLILLCGHYEGMDQRVIDELVDMEVSIGDYVLTGGELAAMVVVDSLIRFIPGVVGNADVHEEESFENGLLEYPQYTRPADFRGLKVPEVLLSGNHSEISKWRRQQSILKTQAARPELLTDETLTAKERRWLENLENT